MGRDRSDTISADETGKLISSDKVVGTAVYNRDGDHLGTIYSVMIHKISGRVAYAVMSFGGFLGIGERYHPLPWDVLTYDETKGGYNIDQSAEQLRDAPNYSREELDTLDYGQRGGEIRDYYGVGMGGMTGGVSPMGRM
ncbi:MAG: PRC-barrel domain-containing protein [Alphaproteobacteria bacterium]|nr:PRC-barrel domain-containing protein [Alphaproteobacteria bacterium]